MRNEFTHSANSISLRDLNIRDRLFAAIDDHPVKNRYIAASQAKASEMGIPVELIPMDSVDPRDLFELIFGLEIEFLNIAFVIVETITELKG